MKHKTNSKLLDKKVKVLVIGAGGTGSHMLSQLTTLHMSLKNLGHPHGLSVTIFDSDMVTPANLGRQNFYQADVGLNKAIVLINRINICLGLFWHAVPRRFTANSRADYDIIIGCVDSRKSRRQIARSLKDYPHSWKYFIDCGNSEKTAQVLIGSNCESNPLPMPYDVEPDLIADIPEYNTPSCSLAEALQKQDLLINSFTAGYAAQLLWSLFRHGGLNHHGYYINLESGKNVPLKIKENT